jgi:hypothetical protein
MATTYNNCNVNAVGPAANGTETTQPVIYINLTAPGSPGAFASYWFFAAEDAKDEMLAVALMAIGTGKSVDASCDAPVAGNVTYTQIYRLYLNS